MLCVISVMLLAWQIRVQYIEQTEFFWAVQGDATRYLKYAGNLMEHGVFSKSKTNGSAPTPDAFRTPGYPAYIALVAYLNAVPAKAVSIPLIYNVTDKPLELIFWPLVYSQAILGALTAGLTVMLGALFLRLGWAVLAGLLTAMSPHLVAAGANILSETLFGVVLLFAIYVFVLAQKKNRPIYWAVSGFGFGVGYLVNPVIFFVPFILCGLAFFFKGRIEKENSAAMGGRMAVLVIPFILVVIGWSARNAVSLPDSASTGADRLLVNLIQGSYPDYHSHMRKTGRSDHPDNPATIEIRQVNGYAPLFFERLFTRFLGDPVHYLNWYLIEKPALLWDWNVMMGQGDVYVYTVNKTFYDKSLSAIASYSLMKSGHHWLLVMAAFSLFFLVKAGKHENTFTPTALYISLVYFSVIYVVTQAEPRYSFPLRPEMYLCAVFFISAMLKSSRNFGKREPSSIENL
ncbi:MAG: ArnT family glycosyltransferase [Gammaproteobacteria bacterium]